MPGKKAVHKPVPVVQYALVEAGDGGDGGVVRLPVITLCLGVMSGQSLAETGPLIAISAPSTLIYVQGDAELPSWSRDHWPREDFDRSSPGQAKQKAHPKSKADAAASAATRKPGPASQPARAKQDRSARNVSRAEGEIADEALAKIVGELLITGFAGKQAADASVAQVSSALREGKLSGVVLGGSNITSHQQLRELVRAISQENRAAQLIVLDQPGGPDSILSEDKGFSFYASAGSIDTENTAHDARVLYREMAKELAALGITLNIGPNEDLCTDEGVNLSAACFGNSSSRVTALAAAFAAGHHDQGVLAALRHSPFFSGMAKTRIAQSPSLALLQVAMEREISDALVIRIKAKELFSFYEPLLYLTWGAKYPGSRSRRVLIVELDIGPAQAPVRYDEAIIRALRLGGDMILLRNASASPNELFSLVSGAIRSGVKSGQLRKARLYDAYRQVKRMKAKLARAPSKTLVAGIAH